MEDFDLTQEQVAQKVGKSRSSVANTLRLFQLPPVIQRLVAENQIAAGHAKALLGTPDRVFQEDLAKRIVAEGLSVRETEEAVRIHGQPDEVPGAAADAPPPPPGAADEAPAKRLRAPGLLELEELLADHLSTRVAVSMAGANGKGKIVIEFAGLEDLERIYRAMAESVDPGA
jgi:ParB family chromosome partitioning protein